MRAISALVVILFMLPAFACASPDGWYEGNITCSLETQCPGWFFFENRTWEDPSLLNEYNIPTYAPPITNQTPAGLWNLTFDLGNATQYWGYMMNTSHMGYFMPNATEPYTGPFTVPLNTSFWVLGWVKIRMETAGEGLYERWLYVNDSLVSDPVIPFAEVTDADPTPPPSFETYLGILFLTLLILILPWFCCCCNTCGNWKWGSA